MANSYAKKFFAELKRDNISDDGAVVITSRKFGLEPTEVREFIGQIKDVELDEPYDNMTKER